MLSLERMRVLMAREGMTEAELEELRACLWLTAKLAVELRRREAAQGPFGDRAPLPAQPFHHEY
jgi:hypothetical protein